MLTNEQLYGTDDVPPIRKEDADKRIKVLQENLEREIHKPFKEQNSYIQSEIIRAIRFWKRMSNQEDSGL